MQLLGIARRLEPNSIRDRGSLLSSIATIDFYRGVPPGGFTKGVPAHLRSDKGEGDIALKADIGSPAVRALLYQSLANATRDEKIQLAGVLARSGDQESVPYLEKLSHDADEQVAQEGLRALRALRARL